jgi:drug/metabolite transporter (DMT)-like permease
MFAMARVASPAYVRLFGARMHQPVTSSRFSPTVIGVACGAGAALCWAAGLVSARHGIAIGLSPLDITLHRFVWAGLAFLPFTRSGGAADVVGLGWRRSVLITLTGGPLLALFSYAGFLLVPLGHGGVIQPSTAALGGLLLSALVLKEKLIATRAAGAAAIVLGLCVIGYEALSTIGAHGILGDLSFVTAGFLFALFGMLLKLWRVTPIRSVAIISVLSLVLLPIEAIFFSFDRLIAVGLYDNIIQALVQGLFSGALATFLFTRSVVLLGASRAAVFPALVPPFTLLIGFVLLGNVPSVLQLIGLVIVLIGFRLTQTS